MGVDLKPHCWFITQGRQDKQGVIQGNKCSTNVLSGWVFSKNWTQGSEHPVSMINVHTAAAGEANSKKHPPELGRHYFYLKNDFSLHKYISICGPPARFI